MRPVACTDVSSTEVSFVECVAEAMNCRAELECCCGVDEVFARLNVMGVVIGVLLIFATGVVGIGGRFRRPSRVVGRVSDNGVTGGANAKDISTCCSGWLYIFRGIGVGVSNVCAAVLVEKGVVAVGVVIVPGVEGKMNERSYVECGVVIEIGATEDFAAVIAAPSTGAAVACICATNPRF